MPPGPWLTWARATQQDQHGHPFPKGLIFTSAAKSWNPASLLPRCLPKLDPVEAGLGLSSGGRIGARPCCVTVARAWHLSELQCLLVAVCTVLEIRVTSGALTEDPRKP